MADDTIFCSNCDSFVEKLYTRWCPNCQNYVCENCHTGESGQDCDNCTELVAVESEQSDDIS